MPTKQTRKNRIIGAVAFAAVLTGGGVAGALLGTPSVSGAQEETTTTTTVDDSTEPRFPGAGFWRGAGTGFAHPSLDTVADQLGLTAEELRTALRDGSTIAELAGDQGVDVDTVIAAAVADVSARIDQAVSDGKLTQERADALKAELTEWITDLVNGEVFAGGFGFGRERGGPGGWFGAGPEGWSGNRGPGGWFGEHAGAPGGWFMAPFGLEVVTEQLGITADELRDELAAGKSIADVAAEEGVDAQTVIDAIVEESTATLEERVTAFVMGSDE